MSEFSSSVPPLEESSIPEHLIPKEEWYEAYVRYGLYVGAAFQLACILAVLVLPGDKGAAAGDGGDEGDYSSSEEEEDAPRQASPHPPSVGGGGGGGARHHQANKRKADKKKKRL